MHLSGDVDAASYYVITHTTTDTAVGNDTDLQLSVPADAATMASLTIELDITSDMIWSFSGSNVTDAGSFTLAEEVAVSASKALTLPVATGDSVSANVMYELSGTFTARNATNAESGSASNLAAISTNGGPINYGSNLPSGLTFIAPTSEHCGQDRPATPTDNGTFVFTYTATDTPNEISTTFTLVVLTDLTPTANTAANEALYGTAGATALDFAPGAAVSQTRSGTVENDLLIYGPTGGNGTLSHSLTTCYYATESDVPSMNPGQCDGQTSSNTAAQATYADDSATVRLPANVSLTLPLGLSARFDDSDFTNATLEGSITNGGFYYLSYSAADTPLDNDSFQAEDVANTATSLTVQINVAAFRFVDTATDIKTITNSYTLKAGAGINSGSISLPAVAGASGTVSYGLSGTHNTGASGASDSTLVVDGTSGVITYVDASSVTVTTGLTFSATARTITGTPAVAGVGTYSLSYTATDDKGSTTGATPTADDETLTDTFDLVVVEDLAVAFSGTTDSTYGSSNPISLSLGTALSQGSDTYLSIAVPKGNGVSPQVITTCYYATEAGRTADTPAERIGCANHDTNTNTADVPTATVGANTGQSLPAGFKARLPAGVALTWTDLTYSAMRLSGTPTGVGFYAITVSVSDVAIGNSFQTADDANTDTLEIFLNVTSSLSFNYTGSNVIDGNLYELEAGTALTTSITLPIPSTPVTPMFALSGTHTSTSTALSLDSSNNIMIGTGSTAVDSGLDYSPLVLTAANARDGTTGTISGTPSSAAAALGSYALTFTYTESGTSITADFTLNVIADITAPALPSGSQNPTLYGASYGTVVSFDPGESLRQVISGTTNNYLLIDAPVGNQPFSTMAISTCYYATEADRNADSSNACSAAINSTNIRSHNFATVGMRSNQPLPGTGSSVTLPAGVTLAFTDNSYEQIQLGGAATYGGHYVINFSVSDSAIDNSLLQGSGTPRTGDTSDSASFAIELAILDPMFDYSASPISDGGQITLEQNVALTSPLILPTANSVFANSTYTLAGTIDVANNGANHHGSGTDLALSQTPGLLTYSGSTSTGLTYVAPTAAAAGRITGTPIAGIYKFTYRVVDNKGTASETADDDSETAAFTLNVLHDLPLAQNPSAVTAYASALDIEFGEPLVQGSNAYLEVSPPGEDQLTSGQYSGGLRPLTQAFSTCYYADAAAQTADSAGTACTNFGTVQQRGQVDASNTAIDLPPGFSARMPNGVQVRWVYDSTSRTWGNARISGTARFEGLYVITYTVTGTSFDTSLQSGAAATARTSTLSIELNIQRDDAPQLSIDDVVREGGTYYYVPNSPLNLELPLASGGEGAILEELTTTCLQPDGSTACAGTQVESQTLSNALGSSASSVPVGVTLSAFQNGSRTRLTGTPTGSGTAVGSYTIVYQIGDSDSNTASCSASGADPETCDTSSVTFTLRPIKLIDADILGTPHITLLTGTALSTAIKLPRADITSVPTATVSYSLSGSADIGDGVIRPIADGELVDDDGSVYALQKVFGVIGSLPTDLTYTETTNSVSGTISGTPDSAVAGTTLYLQYSINHDGGTAGDTSDDFSFSLDLDLTFIADQTVSLAAARMEELDAESLFYFAGEPLSADVNVPFVLPNTDSTGNGALSDALVTCYYANRAAKDADSAGTACSTSSSNLQSGLGNSSPVGITVTNKTGAHPANLTGSVTNPGYYQLTYTISDTAIANTAAYQTADTADSASTTFYLDVRADVPPTLTLSDAETIAVQGNTTVLLTKEDTLQTVDIALPVAAGGNLSLIEQLDTICVNSTTDLARCNSAAVDRTQRQTPTVLSAGAVRALADSTLDYTVNVPRGLTFIPRTGSTAARLTGAIEVSGIYTVTYRVIDNDHNTLACTEISPAYNLGGQHKYEPAQCDTAYISFTLDVQAMLRPTFVTTEESMNLRLPPQSKSLRLPAATGTNGDPIYSLSGTYEGNGNTPPVQSSDTAQSFGSIRAANTGDLVADLSFDTDQRIITVLPSARHGTYALVYTVTDQDPDTVSCAGASAPPNCDTDSMRLTLVVDGAPTVATPATINLTRNLAIADHNPAIAALPSARNGNAPYSYSLSTYNSEGELDGTLPSALGFDAATRTLTGTPNYAGTYSMVFSVADNDGDPGNSGEFDIVVDGTPEFAATTAEFVLASTGGASMVLPAIVAGSGNGVITYGLVTSKGLSLDSTQTSFDAATRTLTILPAIAGTLADDLSFTYSATDADGDTTATNMTITVITNTAPEADAGPDQTVLPGQSVTLDGSASSDSQSTAADLTYFWTQTDGTAVMLDPHAAVVAPSFVAPEHGTNLVFELVVTDTLGVDSLPAQVTVRVAPMYEEVLGRYALASVTGANRVLAARTEQFGNTSGNPFNFSLDDSGKGLPELKDFVLPLASGAGSAGAVTAWGRVHQDTITDINREGVINQWSGDNENFYLGVDVRLSPNSLAGAFMTGSESTLNLQFGDEDDNTAQSNDYLISMRHFNPFLSLATKRVSFWTSAGSGEGTLTVTDSNAQKLQTYNTSMASSIVGFSGLLIGGVAKLRLRLDSVSSELKVDLPGVGQEYVVEADRSRAGIQFAPEFRTRSGFVFSPTLEFSNVTETLANTESEGEETAFILRFASQRTGWNVELGGRSLTIGGYEEEGAYLLFEFGGSKDELGLAASLKPVWGDAENGVEELWGRGMDATALRPTGTGNSDPNSRELNMSFSYGFELPGGYNILEPFTNFTYSQKGASRLDSGFKWRPKPGVEMSLSVPTSLSADRAFDAAPEVGDLLLSTTLNF